MIALVALWAFRTWTVGPGKDFPRIEAAVSAAQPGDEIDVYPGDYARTAIKLNKKLRIVGEGVVVVDGQGFEYSGAGSVPRAIFQFDPGSDGSSLINLELKNAHNGSFNGAGVRINQANGVTIERCDIHDNDMGIMSNGVNGNPHAGEDQLIEHCVIHQNGNAQDPGYNHNLYLGGTSATLRFCDVYGSITGHNVKSRAHLTRIEYCIIHGSANRECDFVEAWDTERPGSDAVIIGSLIVKDPNCSGNRGTINFGQESGTRNGRLWLINDTIVTPFQSAVVSLTSSTVAATIGNCVIYNADQTSPTLVQKPSGVVVDGGFDWISPAYSLSGTTINPRYSAPPEIGPIGSTFRVEDYLLGRNAGKFKAGVFAAAYTPRFRLFGPDRWQKADRRLIGAG